jgi:outer membrane receptor protein involved in Fe transport
MIKGAPKMKASMKAAMAVWLSNIAMSFAMTEYAEAAPVADDSTTLDELVVTAQKRVSTVQDTPISISAVSGDDSLARGVSSLATLAQGTPGVSLKSEGPVGLFDAGGAAARILPRSPAPLGRAAPS